MRIVSFVSGLLLTALSVSIVLFWMYIENSTVQVFPHWMYASGNYVPQNGQNLCGGTIMLLTASFVASSVGQIVCLGFTIIGPPPK